MSALVFPYTARVRVRNDTCRNHDDTTCTLLEMHNVVEATAGKNMLRPLPRCWTCTCARTRRFAPRLGRTCGARRQRTAPTTSIFSVA